MELIDKYLGEEKTRCPKCGLPLKSRNHKENCEGGGKQKQKGKYKLQPLQGHEGWTRYKDKDAKK